MSVINVETLVVQTMGFAVAIAWGGALDKFTKSVYVPDQLKDTPEYKNANSNARAAFAYAMVTTLIIIAIVYIVNNVLYTVYVEDPAVTPNTQGNIHYTQGTLSSRGKGIDIVTPHNDTFRGKY